MLTLILFRSYSFNSANWNSTLTLKALKEPVEVFRDEHGIAYIQAQNLQDALLAQGFVTAQDRLLQLELYRYIAYGRLSEILGKSSLQHDIRMRAINLSALARKRWQRLKIDSKWFISKYIEGINLYIETQVQEYPMELQWFGANLQHWKPEDALTLMYFLSWSQSTNYETEWLVKKMITIVNHQQLKQWLPIEHLSKLGDEVSSVTEGTIQYGSNTIFDKKIRGNRTNKIEILRDNTWLFKDNTLNNFLVGHKQTVSGKTILANDLKFNTKTPFSAWYPVSLYTPNHYFSGFSFVGIPGVLSGRNNHIAFGLTNAHIDVQSLLHIPKDSEQDWVINTREEIIKVAVEKNFEEKIIRIRETKAGPIISDHFESFSDSVETVALSWMPYHSQRSGLGIDELVFSENVQQAQKALQNADILPFSWVLADSSNNIANLSWQLADLNSENDWFTYTLSTAKQENQLGSVPVDYLSLNKNQQLHQYEKKVTAEDVWHLMIEKRSPQVDVWLPHVLSVLEKKSGYLDWYQELKSWNGLNVRNKVAPTLYQLIYEYSFVNILLQNFPHDIVETILEKPYFWQKYLAYHFMNHEKLNVEGEYITTKDYMEAIIHQSVVMVREHLISTVGRNLQEWTWDNLQENYNRKKHAISAMSGWIFSDVHIKDEIKKRFFKIQYNDSSHPKQFFDIARSMVDLADNTKIFVISTGGISARNFTSWTDNFQNLWKKNRWIPIWINPDIQRKQARYHMEINSR